MKSNRDVEELQKARREAIVRIARQSEELGDYDKFIPAEKEQEFMRTPSERERAEVRPTITTSADNKGYIRGGSWPEAVAPEPPKAICPCQLSTSGHIYRVHMPGCPNELRDYLRKPPEAVAPEANMVTNVTMTIYGAEPAAPEAKPEPPKCPMCGDTGRIDKFNDCLHCKAEPASQPGEFMSASDLIKRAYNMVSFLQSVVLCGESLSAEDATNIQQFLRDANAYHRAALDHERK